MHKLTKKWGILEKRKVEKFRKILHIILNRGFADAVMRRGE